MQSRISYENFDGTMRTPIRYESIKRVINHYFDKRDASWKSRLKMKPVSRDELKEEFGLSDNEIIKIQKKYLHLGSKTNPVIVADKGGCLLNIGVKREEVLEAVYNEFASSEGATTIKLPEKACSTATAGEAFA